MKRGHYLPLLILLAVLQVGAVIDFATLDRLCSGDGHPKYFSISVENAELLLKYGTPFGFNPDFQRGIPTFYLRSRFLESIPFALLFGYPVGYQITLIVVLALVPLAFFNLAALLAYTHLVFIALIGLVCAALGAILFTGAADWRRLRSIRQSLRRKGWPGKGE